MTSRASDDTPKGTEAPSSEPDGANRDGHSKGSVSPAFAEMAIGIGPAQELGMQLLQEPFRRPISPLLIATAVIDS